MKIAVLTTETSHHTFFVKALKEAFGEVVVFCETGAAPPAPFVTVHPFEAVRDDYERGRWFGGRSVGLADVARVRLVSSMNSADAIASLQDERPDAAIVFGTGVLKPATIEACPRHLFNLHGGDPELYRGLDTHLWAIYHRDFAGLITTLHRLDVGLDTGDIVLQGTIPLYTGMPLHALRASNTEICLRLSLAALDMLGRSGDVLSRPQRSNGRYYSAMPTDLKSVCERRFASHTGKLGA